jgi:hypothetical protein
MEKPLTLLEENPLQQRVFIPQHQALIGGAAMALLQTLQGVFIPLDGGLQLADVLCPTLAECSLRLAVALLAFLGGGVDLNQEG